MRKSILGMVLAGGEGTRLSPLTTKRAKPAVPFGGKYRIIDFVLSNFVNSGIHSIFVLTQFRSQSMSEHIINGWNLSSMIKGQFIVPVPAQMQAGERWYSGTADAIWQNVHLLKDFTPDLVAIFGGDHIYKMDLRQMAKFHSEKNALATIASIPVPIEEASAFGVIEIDNEGRIIGFQEKPENPTPMPGNPDMCLVSMGNYIFDNKWLISALAEDAVTPGSSHDFGHDILPKAVSGGRLFAYNFFDNYIPGHDYTKPNYWKDVGTLKAYFEATMDLRNANPQLNLYSPQWPIHTYKAPLPPAKFVHNDEGRIGHSINSLICEGCIVSGASVIDSVLSPEVHIHSYSTVENSILLDDVDVARNCNIRNAIIDKHVLIEEGTRIGFDRKEDEARFQVHDLDIEEGTWLTVIEKNHDRVKLEAKTTVLEM